MVKKKVTIPTVLFAFVFSFTTAYHCYAKSSLDSLYEKLSSSDAKTAKIVELEIKLLWARSGSASIDLLFRKGEEAFQVKDYEAAFGHYSAVVEFAPDFPMGWYARSLIYSILGYYGPALSDLEKALILDPHNFSAIIELSRLFAKLGRPDLSHIALDRVLKIHPNFEAAWQLKSSLKRNEIDKQI